MDARPRVIFILVETKYPGNIGLCARAIKNFGFMDLVLVRPLCNIAEEAYYRSMHARDVVEAIRIYESIEGLIEREHVDYLIGTTARVGSEKNPLRISIPLNLFRRITFPLASTIGILFGNEERGLRNEDLAKCDIILTIPTSEIYPTLSLSHAVAIVAYELSLSLGTSRELPYRPATWTERRILIERLHGILEIVGAGMPEGKRKIYARILENMVRRAFLSGREAHSLIGLFSRTLRLLERCR